MQKLSYNWLRVLLMLLILQRTFDMVSFCHTFITESTEGRMRETIATAPAMALTPQAIDNLVEELREYHTIYSPLFQRREQREVAAQYLHGLLLEMPRKPIEPMVLALHG